MSYCRWSSDNFKSDVYVYAHVDGSWTTHVAGRRRIGVESLPDNPLFLGLRGDDFTDAYRAYHSALDALPFEDIPNPEAGATIKDASPQECAATLRRLRDAGFHVPDGVIEELESETEDEET